MAANPIGHRDIEAFERSEQFPLTAWDVRTLCRMDDAALAALTTDTKPAPRERSVAFSDGRAINKFMRGLKASIAARKAKNG